MTVGGILLLILILISHTWFVLRLRHIVKLTNLGQGALSLDHMAKRFKAILIKGFGQQIVLRRLSGVGHALIFWGFIALLFGTVEGLIRGVYHEFSFSFLGPFYAWMNAGQDIFGLLVMAALAVSVFRRLVIRPVRLEGGRSHTADALLIVALIAVLIVAFYGARVIVPKPGWTPVADALRSLILGGAAVPGAYGTAYVAFEWLHNGVVLGFLVYLLYSKHSHIVFALPNLFLKREGTPGRIEKLDLDDEESECFGAQAITDFEKKDLLDLFACSDCGRCQEACPAYTTGKPLSPKKVMSDLKAHLLAVGPALLRNGEAAGSSKPLYSEIIERDAVWSCTTCGACETVCPVENAPMSKIIGIRQSAVLMAGDFPQPAQDALRNIETQSNPWGVAQEERGRWAQGLGVKTLAEDPSVDYLFFVGCAGSYDKRYISVSRALVKILQRAGIRFGILGQEEMCTGDSAKRIGNDYLAQELAKANVDTLDRYGVKKIITSCPHCFNAIKNEYPQYGGRYEVIHHSELISGLIKSGRIQPAMQTTHGANRIAYHDPCYLARYNQVADAPRDLLRALRGNDLVELKRNREASFCCGAGGGRMWMEENIGTGINVNRSREAIASGAKTVATACPFCMVMITDGVNKEGRGEDVQVRDIAEIVADALTD